MTYRVFSDRLGSPRVIVDATTGAVVQRMDFRAFGEIVQDSNPGWQPFGFAGGLYDVDTGLLRFGARDYDHLTGRWIVKDPIGLVAGPNRYEYVGGASVDRVDSTGLDWFRSYDTPGEYVVGRTNSVVAPGGWISRYVEHEIPAGRTFGEPHDAVVTNLKASGVPDWYANVPTMPIAALWAVEREAFRSARSIARDLRDWFRDQSRQAANAATCPDRP